MFGPNSTKISGVTSIATPANALTTDSGISLQAGQQQSLSDPIQQSNSLFRASSVAMDVSLTPVVALNNTPGTATNIGTLSGTRVFSDFVGSSDFQDYYRFSLSGSNNNLNLALTGLSADADVQVFNSVGTAIASSARGSSNDEAINLSGLAGGDYFVRVYQFSGSTNYSLRLSNLSSSNLLPNEVNVGTLSGSRTFSGFISNNNTADVYRFNLGSTSNVALSMAGLSADADVRIIRDSNSNGIVDAGEVIFSSTAGSITSESINLQGLGAGSYFAQVYQFSGSTSYSLNLSAAAGQGWATELNNTIGQAYNIGTLNGSRSFGGFVGSTDTNDFYRFSLGTTSNLNLSLNGLVADADVQIIRDSNFNGLIDPGEVIYSSANGGALPESIDLRGLGAGNYLVRVYQFSGDTNYNLNLSATPGLGFPTEPNNTPNGANFIGTLNGDRSFSGFVGSTDTNDFYRFNLGTTSNVSLSLGNLTADADLQIIRDANFNGLVDPGEVIYTSNRGSTLAESIDLQGLGAGSYLVRVYQFSGDTNYTLNLNATPGLGFAAEPNNTLAGAYSIGMLNGSRSFSGFVGNSDTNDYYSFSLGTTDTVSLSLSGLSADADLYLYNSAGSLIQSSFNGGSASESITRTLAAGTYYAQVNQWSGDTTYTLNFSA